MASYIDLNDLGSFANINALWAAYPEGGQEGDYCTIDGVKYRWDKYDRMWVADPNFGPTPARSVTTFDGDVNMQNNLTVAGYIRAKGIKQPCLGLFLSEAALEAKWPKPEVGMWAIVGEESPFIVYRCDEDGEWTNTEEETTGFDDVDLSSIVINGIKGWVAIDSISELPSDPTEEQKSKGYLLGTTLYIWDGTEETFKSAELKGTDGQDGAPGPQGPKGDSGVDLGEVVLVNDLTTGGEGSALSAEMGKVLNGKVSIEEQSSWGDTTGSSSAYGQYMWPFFKPISQACTVTKLYVNETYASSLASNTSIKLFVAELNAEKTVYSITRLVTATLLAGESSVDLNIDLPANSSLYIEFVYPASQQSFCLVRPDLSDDDAYPQQLVQKGYVSVGTNINVSGTSKGAWGLKFDYKITGSLKEVVEQNTHRIEALEDKADDRMVSYKNPTTLVALGSSLTDVHESYKGGGWLDILNDMVDVVIINEGQSGATRQANFQKLINYGIIHDEENFAKKINPTYIFCANTANMAGTDAVGIGAQADLEYGLNISRLLGSQLIFGTELPMYHESKEFDQTYTSFCRKHNLLVSPYCRIASLLKVDTPYYGFSQGNGSNVHGGYRCKSYALAHYDLLNILPIKKSIKFFEPRPDYQGGSPTYTQLIYENNEERFVKFHALKTGEGAWVGTKGVDNLDNTDYNTSTGTDGGHEGPNGNSSSYTSFMQRGASVSFNKFALCEVILDRINCTKGTLTFDCSVNPSAIYVATRKTTFATPMSEWTLLTHTTENGVVSVNIERSEKDFMLYDKVRILICSSGTFTIAKPSFSGYDGDLKPDIEPLRDYHIRQYGAELLAKTSCEDGWTMGGNASVQSLPTEIANYSGYNSVKSHIELASDSDYCTKSVAITQPCSKVAVRVVANLFPKIATSRTFSQMTDAQKAKYISTTPTITEFGYNFGTLRVSFGNGAVKDFTMWCGWCEYYQEVDVAPTDTSLTLKVERLLAKVGITTNSDFNVFVHDVSVQKIG